jgi:urease accessory protein
MSMTTAVTATSIDPSRISVHPGEALVRVGLVTGAIAPRLVSRNSLSATVALTAAQMLLLDGDSVHIDIEVGAGCTLEVEDIGGTVAYPGTSSWNVRASVGAGGCLLWKGLPFVVTDEGRSLRTTDLTLGEGAQALIRETLVLGRHGETGGAIVSRFTATDRDGPLLVEHLEADGAHPGPGILGSHRVIDSVLALGFRPSAESGDLVMEQPGAVSRFLGPATHLSPLDTVWASWRKALLGDAAAPVTTEERSRFTT